MSSAAALAILSGAFSGFALGLVGGGGSILGTPLLLYVVGVSTEHKAIGTGSVAVSVAALFNFASHATAGHVRWRSAIAFALVGTIGAVLGSAAGKAIDGRKLLLLLGLVMVAVAFKMLRWDDDDRAPSHVPQSDLLVAGLAMASGIASGFFGIGGGFLIVPCLLFATRMRMIDAVGSSLLAVAAFSMATAGSYAMSGLVDWGAAGWFVLGGIGGGALGMLCAVKLSKQKGLLRQIFGGLIFCAGVYVISRSVFEIMQG